MVPIQSLCRAKHCSFRSLALNLCCDTQCDSSSSTVLHAALQDKDSGVQKKSYKVVAYLCGSRPSFIRANLQVCSCQKCVTRLTPEWKPRHTDA